MDTHPLGTLIARLEDEQGPVTVYERDGRRYLSFGNAVEQSCQRIALPQQPVHVYIQAMLLGLVLSPDAPDAMLLGLGGGSLVHALRHLRPRMRIDAVDQRQAVIDAATRHFGLVPDRRLQLHRASAEAFVGQGERTHRLIMLDLYLADGVHPAQTELEFLAACRQRLDDRGLLIANHWCSEFRDSRRAHAALTRVFGDSILYLHVQGGNTIAFGFAGGLPVLQREAFFQQAQDMGLQLQIPLQTLARNFWRQNAEPLQLGRFRRR
ncbi:hypothetical protein F2Q65_00820 [Thiohalocapsa marina]|uniref:Spermidine synthase n=1 Tax=Thiohalocapsa marina TaxID=424902 RepID=A0A5M8FVG6_9GAMM|nr:hypothetical protein [Thiohalocapsa marina]KAA6187818.1 hypothetical protein F2Q65_00820 [Thiohalocapsa marina]